MLSPSLLACFLLHPVHAQISGTVNAQQQTPGPAQAPVPTLTTPSVALELTTPPAQISPAQVDRMQKKLNDWPQLGRYRDENAKLQPSGPGEQRVVFYGDSITDAWGHQHAAMFFPGKPYLDRGISGQTTPQMLARFYQDVIALQPAVVVILAGINDIAGNTGAETLPVIEDNFRAMVTLAKAAHIRVVLSSTLPASRFPWRPGVDPTQEVVELNKWLKDFAAREHVIYLDYYPALVNSTGGMREELAVDKAIHPNDAGYAIMQPLAEVAIRKALAQPRP
jgi:lysophospholipase L1-like esterase